MITKNSILFAIFYSVFIYLSHISIDILFLNTIFALMGVYYLFNLSKKELFFGGFVIGVLWFWWLGYSFIYYELNYLIPIVVLGIGLVYGLIFYFGAFVENIIYRAFYFFIISFLAPFGFNWFKLELPFINSYIGTSKYEFALVLVLSAFLTYFIKKEKLKVGVLIYFAGILSLFVFNSLNKTTIEPSSLQINLYTTTVDQERKWKRKYMREDILSYLKEIEKSISKGDEMIVFPETSFPLVLNNDEELVKILKNYSYDIAIVLGALHIENEQYHNSTYFFNNGNMQIAHKVVLVPFGEAVPLPAKIRDFINDTFYDGAKDYDVASEPTTFKIKDEKFRNAICFEATTDKVYENLDTNYAIVTSNNAWFTPSIQPTLQGLLLKYYAKKYNIVIYNVANKSKSGIIRP